MSDDATPSLVFKVSNHHVADCGRPPEIDGDVRNQYASYFENEHSEQAVFVYDYDTDEAVLWMGDWHWEKPIPVVDAKPQGVIVNRPEALWLEACWEVITPVRECLRQKRIESAGG
jgi:hypothetical protein